MFNPIRFILGWNWRVRRLRKRWDRLREKSLKKDASMRATLLPREDQIEQNLRILEERKLNRRERARLAKEVEIDLAEIAEVLKGKPEEMQRMPMTQPQSKEQQKILEEQQRLQREKEKKQAY